MQPRRTPSGSQRAWSIADGEAVFTTSAGTGDAERVVIDDLEGRRCAKAMGLTVIGTLGIVGRAKAFEMAFTGDVLKADECLQIGLVHKVVPHDDLMAACMTMAKKIAAKPPEAPAPWPGRW